MKIFNCIAAILFVTALPLTAIPGVKDILPTESGQYVYYRDNGFRAETYIGFLQYDEATYAIRYYSPNPESGSNEVELLINVDPEQNYILMTGERIVSQITRDDNETVNYMHDIFYELSSRRKKMNEHDLTGTNPLAQNISPAQASTLKTIGGTVHSNEDFLQFGGEVQLTYDVTIPIFNLQSIYSAATTTTANTETREMLFMAVTMGQLTDSDDQSFSNFTGIPSIPSIILSDEKLTDTQIEESWNHVQDGIWLLNSDALMLTYELEIDQVVFEHQNYTDLQYLSRKLSFANTPNLLYLPAQSIFMKNESLVLENLVYDLATQLFTHTTTIVSPSSATPATEQIKLYTVTTISAYYNYYHNNIKYFQGKVNSIIE